MNVRDAWAVLGIEATNDAREVKRAYARVLKTLDADTDPAAFVRLRDALETALAWGTETPDWDLSEEEWEARQAEEERAWIDDGMSEGVPLPPGALWDGLAWPGGGWRPAAPEAIGGELGELARELESALFDAAEDDADRIAALGVRIFERLEQAPVGEATQLESWLASALAAAIPRSDPLIGPAVARFGWGRSASSWRDNLNAETVLQRREDLGFVRRCRRVGHPQHRAYSELRGPPRKRLGFFRLGLASDVRNLLRIVAERYPTVERDFNPETLQWWRDYFERPHLPGLFWVFLLGVPPFIAFALAIAWENQFPGGAPVIPLYLASAAAVLSALVAYSFVSARLARAVRERQCYFDARNVPAERCIAAALALPPLAAVVGGGAWTAALFAAASLAVAIAALIVAPPRLWEAEEESAFRRSFAIVGAVCAAAITVGAPANVALSLFAPFTAFCFVAMRCHEAAIAWFRSLARPRQLALLLASAMAAVAAAAQFFVFAPSLPPAWGLALVPIVVAGHHLATGALFLATPTLDWPLRACAAVFYFVAQARYYQDDQPRAIAASVCLYGLAFSLIRVGLAVREIMRAQPDART